MENDNYKLLIADDEEFSRKNILSLINWKEIGISGLFLAEDGVEAEEMIETKKPDILLLDIRMPRLNGVELVERLKKNNSGIKVIVISAYSDFKVAQKLISIGIVSDYILKPVDADVLEEAIIKCIHLLEEDRNKKNADYPFDEEIADDFLQIHEDDSRSVFSDLNSEQWIEDVKAYVDRHISENLSLTNISSAFFLSPSYFSRVFSEREKCGFSDYLSNIRIEKAKNYLISNHDMRIYEIAEKVGFNSPQYFVTSFRDKTGMTPAAYRTKHYFDKEFE